ncbi:unnamed protein product [Effrenium voratum]|uniref:Uncharacterized protein n=1 Tax=Effrenium voratum TaxID=2562239 RepID=A0AA36I1L6_9DINO|nr:unnamed protein product [Effrenium voratum]
MAYTVGSGQASVNHARSLARVYDSDLFTSQRERGLHERAKKARVSLPCPITMVPILLRESSELDAAASLVEWPFILPHEFVRTLVAEGYLNVLVGDVKDIPGFWEHFLKDFPDHPAAVATLHCFITGFRGDWKALKQVFNLRRHASTDEICWLCKACKGLDDDQSPLIFTDARNSAAFWGTIGLEDPWSQSPSYATLVGFSGPGMIHADLLHVYHLGVGRDACGALLKLMMSKYPTVFFEGNNIPAKMQAATKQLKEYAALHKLPLRMKRFSKAKISWKKKSFPELKSSGYDTYVISRWLGHVLSLAQGRNDEINKWATMMWAINLVLSLLSRAGRWLTPEEQDNKVVVGKIFVTIYLSLAFDSIQNNVVGECGQSCTCCITYCCQVPSPSPTQIHFQLGWMRTV